MKTRLLIIGLFALILLINTFIFANSLDSVERSNEKSDAITEVVDNAVDGEQDSLTQIVRKSAHLIEFCLLGIAVAIELYLVKKVHSKRFYSWGCFYALSVAVLDEYIQSFSDRSDSVRDVVLDFCGFSVGAVIAVVGIIVFTIINKKRRKENNETEHADA